MTVAAAKLAAEYLQVGRVMQIATLQNGQPRVNSVYYVVRSDNKAIYWVSEPRRRHSRALESNPSAGAAIVIRSEAPVAGLQLTGVAAKVTDLAEIKESARLYSEKYDGVGGQLYERIVAGTNKNKLYRLDIDALEIFDDENFPGDEAILATLP